MQGLILAAGMGRRLGELTKNNPKCMVTVNGVTLTKRLLLEYDLLIKDLSRKIRMGDRQFVRLAVRDRADNLRLVAALTAVLA